MSTPTMHLGVAVPISGSWATTENVVEIARLAEDLGYHSLWTFQRLLAAVDALDEVPDHVRRLPLQQIDVGLSDSATGPLMLRLSGPAPSVALAFGDSWQHSHGPWRLQVECGWPLSADYLAQQRAAPAIDPVVEVVVPVYGGLEHVRQCLASVMASKCQASWHLTVIDDASPDPQVPRWLREFAILHPEVTVLFNARNLGFVGTVNLGMQLAARRDVILLNSDTEVSGNWIDRLQRAAHAGSKVGTVTPFSNNATICSYPRFCEPNALPAGHTTASLDRLFASLNAQRTVDVPTAVGFCMYIRRDCLDATGWFDAQTFGAGYGEENDFCLRATALGWRHVHALDTFVRHAGGVSFSDRQQALQASALAAIRRLHPHYEDLVRDYVQLDPARPYRDAVTRALSSA